MATADVEREFEGLYRRYEGDVLGYSDSVLHDRDDAEDVAQSTFLKAYRALRDGVRPEHPREWLITIARHECGMRFRAAARRPVEVGLDDELPEPEHDDARAAEVTRALEQLNEKQRTALVLREFEGRSYGEIAIALGISGAAVETLLFRARRALREQLETGAGCTEARQLMASEAPLAEADRARLRSHVRSCQECAKLERKHRGLRAALARAASLFPFPSWLTSFFSGAATKTAAGVAVAALAAGGTVAVKGDQPRPRQVPPVRQVVRPRTAVPAATPAVPAALTPAKPHEAVLRAKVGLARAAAHRVVRAATRAASVAPAVDKSQAASPTSVAPGSQPAVSPTPAGAEPESQPESPPTSVATADPAAPVHPDAKTTDQPTAPLASSPQVPQVTAPEVKVPQVQVPQLPAVTTPQLPTVTTPQLPQVPAVTTPQTPAPVPQVTTPQVTVPQVTTPQVPVPQVTTPQLPPLSPAALPQPPQATAPQVPTVTTPKLP